MNGELDRPLVFFDSGIGGATVLREAKKAMPYEDYIYFSDADNIPYGTKSSEEIRTLVIDAVRFLDRFKPKALILACNTATSVVVQELRELYSYPIIGMEPAVKPATELCDSSRILLCATDKTLEEEKLEDLINGLDVEDRVERMSLQELVVYAENKYFDSDQVIEYLRSKFAKVNWTNYNSLVLGCTHFIYFKDQIRSVIPSGIKIIDGNMGTVNRIMKLVSINTTRLKDNWELFFISKKIYPKDILETYISYLETKDHR